MGSTLQHLRSSSSFIASSCRGFLMASVSGDPSSSTSIHLRGETKAFMAEMKNSFPLCFSKGMRPDTVHTRPKY